MLLDNARKFYSRITVAVPKVSYGVLCAKLPNENAPNYLTVDRV